MDNSITDNRGSGKRSPFSNYQDGSGFGTTNRPKGLIMPSVEELAKSQKSPKKMKKTLKKATPPKPRNQGARFDLNSKGLKRGRKGPISDRRAKKLDRRIRRNAL
jgi:hypothetical protein